jgi:CSLREA domain-containing protein
MDSHTALRTIASLAMVLAFRLNAATITVNSTGDLAADDGTCTLREAIVAANTNVASGATPGECAAGEPAPAIDSIVFAIPGGGVHTIQPATVFPQIIDPVTIDGYTQPGASPNTLAIGDDAVLQIEIDGTNVAPASDLIEIAAADTTIRGIDFNRIAETTIYCRIFVTTCSNPVIEGNFFGTDPTGTIYLVPDNGSIYTMLRTDGANGRIGGASPAQRNVFSAGNPTIMIQGDGTVVQGNYIGVDATGTTALQPPSQGVGVSVGLAGAATHMLIGGDGAGEGNVIAANNAGIDIHYNGTSDVTVEGNLLNTDAAGTTVIASGQIGIQIPMEPPRVTVGGAAPNAGNVIGGFNIGIVGSAVDSGIIEGNHIGVDRTDTLSIPNNIGIEVGRDATSSRIGGTDPGEGNTIAHNCSQGLAFSSATGWAILGNAIFSNRGLGIDSEVPLPNDEGDADTGNNNQQNYPVITSAVEDGGNVTVSGTLNSAPATTFRIELFANVACNVSGYGPGETFLGTTDVTTDADGNASFGPLTFAAPANADFTATATDPGGNTSEFSACVGPHDRMFHSDYDRFECAGY